MPIPPFALLVSKVAIAGSMALSLMALACLGLATSLFNGKPGWFSATRQIVIGIAAALVTYGIGIWKARAGGCESCAGRASGSRSMTSGQGHSSLGLLSQLPVDLLKIDRSFIKGLPDDAASKVLAESIIRLASAFKLITVAEGVETEGQLEAVRELGCSLSQGYLHHAPMPRRELEEVMAEGSRSRTYQEASGAPSRV